MNFIDIFEGWRNHLFPPEYLKERIKQIHDVRYAICIECELHSSRHNTFRPDEHCTECGCPIHAKLKCLSCECGIHKWNAVLTQEQEEEITIRENDDGTQERGEVEIDSFETIHRNIDGRS
jgi:hypothetical protein